MMSALAKLPERQQIEEMVLKILNSKQDQIVQLQSREGERQNPLVVNVSARHIHLDQATLDVLFGKGSQLATYRELYNGGFASDKQVNIIAKRNRMISGVRVLGPLRDYNQVELSFSDGIYLGLDLPVRISGNLENTPGCTLVGPNGSVQLNKGVIRAQRHVHMGSEDLKRYQVKDGDTVKVHIIGTCGTILDNVVVRYGENMKLEVHIDTDEGNACNLENAERLEIIKQF